MRAKGRLYLDHAAGSPLDPAALEAMDRVLRAGAGNPSSPHLEGRIARDTLEEARTRVATALGCRPREVLFTGTGTEACQLGLRGAARARRSTGQRVVVSAVEHPAVAEAADALEQEGFGVDRVPVEASGGLDPARFASTVGVDTAVAALMLANHEMGALFPVSAVAEALRARAVPLLCDAALGPGRVPVRPDELGADLIAFSGHKIGGPPGVGVLYVRRKTRVLPLLTGGLQEERLRPGTENVAAAVGFAAAFERALEERAQRAERYDALVRALLDGMSTTEGWKRVGATPTLPGLVTIEIPGVEGEAAMINLDLDGIAVATGSTCALGSADPSPTLIAMGFSAKRAASTVRFSFGEGHAVDDARRAAGSLSSVVARLRALARG
jgi:cysteine desulfurase